MNNLSARQLLQDCLNKGQLPSLNLEHSQEQRYYFQQILELSFLHPLFADPCISEILLLGPQQACFAKAGKLHPFALQLAQEDYFLLIEALAVAQKEQFHYRHPFVSFQTQYQGEIFRVSLSHQCLSPRHLPTATFRRVKRTTHLLESFFPLEFEAPKKFCQKLLLSKKNILISGATASGKTSLLRSLLREVPSSEHVLVLEDCYEILPEHPLQTNLISSDEDKKSLADYCRYALRMRPDRIILGEIRGAEVAPFMMALNTGHGGTLASIHANHAQDALKRVATLFCIYGQTPNISYERVLELVCNNIQYVFQMKNCKIIEIAKVLGQENGHIYSERVFKSEFEHKSLESSQ